MAFLGSTGSAGGGGSELWLPGLGGSLRWVVGGLVKVREASDWAGGGCGGSLLVGWILDRKRCRCLLWGVRAVVSLWV